MSLIPFLSDEDVYLPPAATLVYPMEILSSLFKEPKLNHHHDVLNKDSSIIIDKHKFQASVDVQQFMPEELSVKLSNDNMVIIEGKHEEKEDHHGFISRHFVRKYILPEDCDISKLKSKLSTDGILTISAPIMNENKHGHYTDIPIIKTGPVHKKLHKPNDK